MEIQFDKIGYWLRNLACNGLSNKQAKKEIIEAFKDPLFGCKTTTEKWDTYAFQLKALEEIRKSSRWVKKYDKYFDKMLEALSEAGRVMFQ